VLLVKKFLLILGNRDRLAAFRSALFDDLFTDGNGTLMSVDDLKLGLYRLEQLTEAGGAESLHMTDVEVEKLFLIIDTDGSGDLDFDEFMEFTDALVPDSDEQLELEKCDPKEELIEKFRLILGNRDRLASLRSCFDDIDTDGNGTLSFDELKLWLEQLSQADEEEESPHMTDAEVQKLFLTIDTNGSGSLDFDEFMKIAKIELEKGELEKEFASADDFNNESQDAAKSAAAKGVRFNRSASVDMDPKVQGDLDMLRASAVEARARLRANEDVQTSVRQWWDAIDKDDGTPDNDSLMKDDFVHLMLALQRMLDPDADAENAVMHAEADWKEDSKGHETMDYQLFFSAVYELVDHWTTGLSAEEYLVVLQQFKSCHMAALESNSGALKEQRKARASAAAAASAARLAATTHAAAASAAVPSAPPSAPSVPSAPSAADAVVAASRRSKWADAAASESKQRWSKFAALAARSAEAAARRQPASTGAVAAVAVICTGPDGGGAAALPAGHQDKRKEEKEEEGGGGGGGG
jgi:Ca2+-binding EF-hand superfamily protein